MDQTHRRSPDVAGRRRRPAVVLALLIVVAAVGVAATEASASSGLPVSPTFLNAGSAYHGLQVKPATITYTGDGTGFLGGANVRKRKAGIEWTQWTTDVALGTGFNQLNNCKPSCAGGTYRGYRVKIELWRPRTLVGRLVFTRMTIFYEKRPPRGEPRHYTFTDTHASGAGGGFGWGPPDRQDYCTHTYGMKPAAGCKNVNALP